MIPGDGVGPDLAIAVERLVEATKAPIDFEVYCLAEDDPDSSECLKTVIKSIHKNRVCLKGILAAPLDTLLKTSDNVTLNMKMRGELDLYASVMHVKKLPGIKTIHKTFDFFVIREFTEGYYSALEHEIVKGVVETLKIVTATNSFRIAKFAFDFALKYNRKRVTAVHQADIIKLGDGTFLECCREVSKYR